MSSNAFEDDDVSFGSMSSLSYAGELEGPRIVRVLAMLVMSHTQTEAPFVGGSIVWLCVSGLLRSVGPSGDGRTGVIL